ncbi:MAG: hypothetical protein A3H98_02420 [Bacteroidetes bacterium RIFCSPLOWO2_02_FULL_36_8]|nr:MAG: hypothetical protein A3H98_02420 [Bacteroidetes bacterium RIFCSPLOWO2_02_FULL_36_8]OFY70973.1 MAG: hypothetical protein A3G23_12725 [Bacteroidetes bacterium RIFCSPLOWO2_12_FULL_37_12]
MAIIYTKKFSNGNRLALWELTEEREQLEKDLQMDETELLQYQQVTHPERARQWLAARVCLKDLIGREGRKFKIVYNELRKPCSAEPGIFFSISHTRRYVSVIYGFTNELGLDIEYIHPRIFNIKEKFVTPEEETIFEGVTELEKYHIIWGAKECLFKVYSEQKLDYKANLIIEQFSGAQNKGECTGAIRLENKTIRYTVHYEIFEGHLLAYIIDTPLS